MNNGMTNRYTNLLALVCLLLLLGFPSSRGQISQELEEKLNVTIETLSSEECRDGAYMYLDDNRDRDEPCESFQEDGAKEDFMNRTMCNEDDYDKVKDTLCGGVAIRLGLMTFALCLLAQIAKDTLFM